MTSLPPESQPSYEAAGQYAPPPAPAADGRRAPGSKTLGVVAFVAALVAVVAGSILAYVGGTMAGGIARYAESTGSGSTIDTSAIPAAAQATFATGGILVVLGFVIAGVFALWALIQGIIAAVKNRGRGWGIAAIVVGVLSFVPVSLLLGVGTAAGIAAS